MASANNRGKNSARPGSRSGSKSSGSRTAKSKSAARKSPSKKKEFKNLVSVDDSIRDEVILLIVLAICILVYVALFGGLKTPGSVISGVFLGLFGIVSYILPVIIFFALAFYMSNKGRGVAYIKVIAAILLLIFLASLSQMMFDGGFNAFKVSDYYKHCAENKCGGGFFGGALSFLLMRALGKIGTYIILFILAIACIVLITERSFFNGIKRGSETIYTSAKDSHVRYQESRINRRKEREQYLKEHPEEAKNKKRRDNVVSGVTKNTEITEANVSSADMKEIEGSNAEVPESKSQTPEKHLSAEKSLSAEEPLKINIRSSHNIEFFDDYEEEIAPRHNAADPRIKSNELYVAQDAHATEIYSDREYDFDEDYEFNDHYTNPDYSGDFDADSREFDRRFERNHGRKYDREYDSRPEKTPDSHDDIFRPHNINITGENIKSGIKKDSETQTEYADSYVKPESKSVRPAQARKRNAVYKFPPFNMLKHAKKNENVESVSELKSTAARLQEALKTFGVNVNITDIAQGPAVTRYEMSLESGTKVSKITGLSDDIKLAMAAKDVRIEAPIPGKSAVGIEIPNKEVSMVSFRELIENKKFKEAESKISFAVGKDLSGDTVVADIGKMPHMLIAGATGSGKSVCINTLIMSIIYKAKPDEVKLIMIDPKVVELSVYNGIPHLLIPVVTDPRKAASALNWGVAEMTDRYNKFAEYGVRDLKGYNKKVSAMSGVPGEDKPEVLPQIIIIVDELADLMMVASKEVEEAICRLAQLARAAGIHLVIATQRPSVDVITGLIKANMPSRIAFAVSSGVDSRTILDMNGAERLLGKGDMLFYPQGYSKPVRVQGAFISDEEISDIVDFLKTNAGGDNYSEDVIAKVNAAASGSDSGAAGFGGAPGGGSDGNDEFFVQAARLVIEQDKASIGYFQRKFKIGFNRAARIMDQLYEAGIVAAEEGTKPRKVLMSMEQFENALEQGEF